ncbi:MAG TPA: glutaredoxin 3 [Methylovirgula sp.]|nr:glutaredoxin 3 [Methylovirgula sp.]
MPSPVDIVIYTTRSCPYCRLAKELLRKRGLAYEEISVDGDFEARAKMMQRAHSRSTVPQIFFGDTHIGGCDELYELDASGKLDLLLADLPR